MSEADSEAAVEAMASLIIHQIKSKGRKMQRKRLKPTLRMILEERKPQDELPGLYERLGSWMRRRGEVESELNTLRGGGTKRSTEDGSRMQTLEGERERIQKEIKSIDGQIRTLEERTGL